MNRSSKPVGGLYVALGLELRYFLCCYIGETLQSYEKNIMVVANLVKIAAEMLKILSKYDVRTDDYRYADMYFLYTRRRAEHVKHSCIVTELSGIYGLSESTVERILRRLRRDVIS